MDSQMMYRSEGPGRRVVVGTFSNAADLVGGEPEDGGARHPESDYNNIGAREQPSPQPPPPPQQEERGGGGGKGAVVSGAVNLLLKLLFYLTIILQVVLWPSVISIVFASVIALEGLITLFSISFCGAEGTVFHSLVDYSLLLLHNRRVSTPKYIAACLIGAYQLFFFVLYVAHQTQVLPVQTTWVHPTLTGQYRFSQDSNEPLPGDVMSDVSVQMRNHPFVWPRTLQRPAVAINGSVGGLPCGGAGAASAAYSCFSAKLAAFSAPFGSSPYAFVPFTSQFYTADVIVTPPAGTTCASLEVYRIMLDGDLNVAYDLDYPASADHGDSVTPAQPGTQRYPKCGLFGQPSWCLAFQHPFTDAQYRARIADKCKSSEQGQLVIRLPPRAADVYGDTGRIGHDVLLVTAGANVQMRWLWHDAGVRSPLLNVWEQTATAYSDHAQSWREASGDGAVFFKFMVVVIPLLIVWYFLAVSLQEIIVDYQVLMACLFVLIPAALLFLTVGAWLPMAGAILCVVAINHTPYNGPETSSRWAPYMRYLLLFITSASNATYLIWVLVLIQQAGWASFMYDSSIHQLADATSQFIVSGYPNWVGLLLPVVLLTNLAFLLGAGICVGMELAAHARSPPSSSSFA